MNIKLTKPDCNNVKVAILNLSKSREINEEGMLELLSLSQKFNWEEPKVVQKKGVKQGLVEPK